MRFILRGWDREYNFTKNLNKKQNMKIINFLTLISLLLLTLLLTESCDKPEDCTNTICNNGGTCVEGVCDCPDGVIGTNCESFDLTQIQALLDEGKTPKELYDGNVPLESLYGKIYKDGFIFYLNTTDGTGLVAALSDQGDWVPWGCWGQNIMGLNDVIGGPLDPFNPCLSVSESCIFSIQKRSSVKA